MSVPVDIYVKDESVSPVPIVGADVAVFNPSSQVLVSETTTDSTGRASLLLPGSVTPGTLYEVRVYKLGVNFHGLHSILVTDPALVGAPNKFDITGADSNILPLSGSSQLCCCTGVFLDLRGQPYADKMVRFSAAPQNIDKTPKVFGIPSNMLAQDYVEVRTDANGRVSVNLPRTAVFQVTFAGDDDTNWDITVPDRDSVNLIDLIHRFPVLWAWDQTAAPGNAVTVPSTQTVEVPVTVTFTDYSVESTDLSDFFDPMVIADGAVIEASYDANRGVMVITGKNTGVTTITPQLKTGILPNRWPVPTVTVPVLTITVV